MTTDTPPGHRFLVLSRGKWDADKTPEQIQQAIDAFYRWYDGLLAEGRILAGHRLSTEGRRVARTGITDGPFSEAKELIGGYWFIVARDLDEAAGLASANPCIACGLSFEVRPIEAERASAYRRANETPDLA